MTADVRTTTVDVRGTTVPCLVGGDGPPLLWLHGAGGSDSWSPAQDALAGSFTVWAPAHPGFAGTPMPQPGDGADPVDMIVRMYEEQAASVGDMPHAKVMRSMELFADKVLPHLPRDAERATVR